MNAFFNNYSLIPISHTQNIYNLFWQFAAIGLFLANFRIYYIYFGGWKIKKIKKFMESTQFVWWGSILFCYVYYVYLRLRHEMTYSIFDWFVYAPFIMKSKDKCFYGQRACCTDFSLLSYIILNSCRGGSVYIFLLWLSDICFLWSYNNIGRLPKSRPK